MGFRQGQRGPALFFRGGPEGFVIAPACLEQREQIVLVHARFQYAARFGGDRLLSFVVQNRHRSESSTLYVFTHHPDVNVNVKSF
jgi:capsule polysaccharide modification protein KpsS